MSPPSGETMAPRGLSSARVTEPVSRNAAFKPRTSCKVRFFISALVLPTDPPQVRRDKGAGAGRKRQRQGNKLPKVHLGKTRSSDKTLEALGSLRLWR
jgi:hypothetical protein